MSELNNRKHSSDTACIDIVGSISEDIFKLLNVIPIDDKNIYIGETNIDHIKKYHPEDYNKYGGEIKNILANPDYVGKNPKDGSIEFVKGYKIDNKYVKVAVRLNVKGDRYYARSLYTLKTQRVNNFIIKGTLKKVGNIY